MIGFAESPRVTTGEAAAIERVLGIGPRGRRDQFNGVGPWLTRPPNALIEAMDVIALPKALRATRDASDDELELALGIVVTLIRYLPLIARMLAVVTEDNNHADLGNAQSLDDDPQSAMLMVPVVVSMLRAGWSDDLAASLELSRLLHNSPGGL